MVKRLMKSIREFKGASIKAPIFVSLEVVMEVVIPLIMADLIDRGINGGNMPYILKTGLILVLAALMSLCFGALAGKYAATASAGFAKNLRRDMYSHVQEYSFSNIDKFSTGGLVTRLTTDVTNVQNAYQMVVRIAVRAPFMLVFSLGAAICIDWQLSVIFLAFIPVLGIGLYLVATHAHPIFERVFKLYDRLNGVVGENLRGIRVVKSFVREAHEDEKFDAISQDIYQDFSLAERILAFNMPLMQFSVYGCMLLISWFGAQPVVACGGDAALGLSTGELTSLFTYTMQILSSLMMLSMVFVMIVISRASMERIDEVLQEPSAIVSPENAVTKVADGSVVFDNVTFRYNAKAEKPVLDHVSLTIPERTVTAIVGPSGAGKSTLCNLIARFWDVDDGKITIGGIDVRDYTLDSLLTNISEVFQKVYLFADTIENNIKFGNPAASHEEVVKAAQKACCHEFIMSLPDGYGTVIGEGGATLSGGEKQRISIARAILKDAPIIILDEATSSVDPENENLLMGAIAELTKNKTVIMIAHRLKTVRNADQIFVLSGGHIVQTGKHEDLIRQPGIYADFIGIRKKAIGWKLK